MTEGNSEAQGAPVQQVVQPDSQSDPNVHEVGSSSLPPNGEPEAADSQVASLLSELREFLAGRRESVGNVDPSDKPTRQAAAKELLSVIKAGQPSGASLTRESDSHGNGPDSPLNPEIADVRSDSDSTASVADQARDRARQIFMDHGYFDDAIETLRSEVSTHERAAAARAMGELGNPVANVHLIAALFDASEEVREAATTALAQLADASAGATADETVSASLDSNLSIPSDDIEANREASPPLTAVTATAAPVPDLKSVPEDEARLMLDEEATRKALEELEQRLGDTATSRTHFEQEAALRLENEARLNAEAASRRHEEEQLRQQADAEAARRRAEEDEKLAAAHMARVQADKDALRVAEEDARLRLEVNRLRVAAEELARTRADMKAERAAAAERTRLAEIEQARHEAAAQYKTETERLRNEEAALKSANAEAARRREEVLAARHDANEETLRLAEEREHLAIAESSRRAEAERLRTEADERARTEQEQLVAQVESMRRVAEEVAARRAEVEAARKQADREAQQLMEAHSRMKAAEAARQAAEAERVRIEADLIERTEQERRLLDEVRQRAEIEEQRLEEEQRTRVAEQEVRVAQLTALRERLENEAHQLAERERQISGEIESFRIADMQVRKRIEDAETRRRTAEESYRRVAEQTQRLEAEARKSELEEERILAKLEDVRRSVAVATQSAVEQEKRIKEETQQLRALEEAQRRRVEEVTRNRVEAELRLQHERERLQSEEHENLRATQQFHRLVDSQPGTTDDLGEWHDDPEENLRPSRRPSDVSAPTTFMPPPVSAPGFSIAASAPQTISGGSESYASAGRYEDNTRAQSGSIGSAAAAAGSATAMAPAALVSDKDEFNRIAARFDDPSPEERNVAARELRGLDPHRMVEWLNVALEGSSPERRKNIGAAIAASGLAGEVIDMLGAESREETYSALCLLLTMAKSGEVEPLVKAIENHDNVYVRIAAVRLLTLNGQEEIANAAARRRLEGPISR